MAEPKGDKLFVNLAASQVRRRLKRFGHGVRKVQSAGRNQAVIIHTATGHNLRELEAKFCDVGSAASERELGESIQNIRNLGPTATFWLREVGIRTAADLKSLGSVAAFQLVKQRFPKATLNLLWALAAALVDKDWRQLSAEEKVSLQKQLVELNE